MARLERATVSLNSLPTTTFGSSYQFSVGLFELKRAERSDRGPSRTAETQCYPTQSLKFLPSERLPPRFPFFFPAACFHWRFKRPCLN